MKAKSRARRARRVREFIGEHYFVVCVIGNRMLLCSKRDHSFSILEADLS